MEEIRFHFPAFSKPVMLPSTSVPTGITSRSNAYTGSTTVACTKLFCLNSSLSVKTNCNARPLSTTRGTLVMSEPVADCENAAPAKHTCNVKRKTNLRRNIVLDYYLSFAPPPVEPARKITQYTWPDLLMELESPSRDGTNKGLWQEQIRLEIINLSLRV